MAQLADPFPSTREEAGKDKLVPASVLAYLLARMRKMNENHDEAGRFSSGPGGPPFVGTEKIGRPLAEKYRAAVSMLAERFPGPMSTLKGIVVRPFGAGETRTTAMYQQGRGSLDVNARFKTEGSLPTGYAFGDEDPATAALTHEFGHHVEATMFGNAWGDLSAIPPVSQYDAASTGRDSTEHWAEVFTAYVMGSDDPVIKAWGSNLESELTKGGRGWSSVTKASPDMADVHVNAPMGAVPSPVKRKRKKPGKGPVVVGKARGRLPFALRVRTGRRSGS